MKHVKKSILLWYTPHEMYELVTAVKDYPKFLPWCEKVDILETHQAGVTARIHLHYAGIRQAFTTRNEQVKDKSVVVGLVDGPFSKLDGTWNFMCVGSGENACKIEFDMCYAFANFALEALVSPVFDRVANTFVDSFVKRAEQVYGPR